jgi:NitT/TauT family transport system substrate-binding protein
MRVFSIVSRLRVIACALFIAIATTNTPLNRTAAADIPVIRVGKAQAVAIAFLPIDIGQSLGIWDRLGIKVEPSSLRGDAQVQQAMTAGSVDLGLGSGPGLGFIAKGVPALGVAVIETAPADVCLILPPNSPVKRESDLKGKHIGVTTAGSLTDWLTRQIAVRQGWPADAITSVALGDAKDQVAAMKTGTVDGIITGTETGYDLQLAGSGKVYLTFGNVVSNFAAHVIYARTDFLKDHPDLMKKFLAGWYESVAYMRTHRAESIKMSAQLSGLNPAATAQAFDSIIPTMSRDGNWNDAALAVLSHSFVDLGILDHVPDPNTLITRKFVPVHT